MSEYLNLGDLPSEMFTLTDSDRDLIQTISADGSNSVKSTMMLFSTKEAAETEAEIVAAEIGGPITIVRVTPPRKVS